MHFRLNPDWSRHLPGWRRWFGWDTCPDAEYQGWTYIALTCFGITLVWYQVHPQQAALLWLLMFILITCVVGNSLALLIWLLT